MSLRRPRANPLSQVSRNSHGKRSGSVPVLKPPAGVPTTRPMALRTSTLPSSRPAPADWRARVEQTVAGAAAAVTTGDLAKLADAFAEVAGWDDAHRAHQARCGIVEVVLAYRPSSPDAWVGPFFTSASCLLDALEREPREPALLNHAGVFLYELLEAAAAEDLFKAALR